MRFKNFVRPFLSGVVTWIVVLAISWTGHAQERGQGALSGAPGVGDSMPDVQVYLPDGTPFSTSELKGNYTVLVFGCLT